MVPRIAEMNLEPGKDGAVYPSQCWTSGDQTTRGDCEGEAQPEFVAKHGHGMTRVAVAALGVGRHFVTIPRFGGLFVTFVGRWSILPPNQIPQTSRKSIYRIPSFLGQRLCLAQLAQEVKPIY